MGARHQDGSRALGVSSVSITVVYRVIQDFIGHEKGEKLRTKAF